MHDMYCCTQHRSEYSDEEEEMELSGGQGGSVKETELRERALQSLKRRKSRERHH